MLKAILRSKAGRVNLPGETGPVSWREVFRYREDLLTAVFFGRLRYLSPTTANNVMALLVGDKATAELGDLKSLELWRQVDGTNGRDRVEPDVEICFSNALVIVEVKPPFGGKQSIKQWCAQIQAIAAEMADTDEIPQNFHYVALGRNTFDANSDTLTDFGVADIIEPVIHQVEWDSIAQALPKLHVNATASDSAVLEDWAAAFVLFGMSPPEPFHWGELIAWSKDHSLTHEQILWHIWPTPVSDPETQTSAAQKLAGVDWSALQNFSTNHRLRPYL